MAGCRSDFVKTSSGCVDTSRIGAVRGEVGSSLAEGLRQMHLFYQKVLNGQRAHVLLRSSCANKTLHGGGFSAVIKKRQRPVAGTCAAPGWSHHASVQTSHLRAKPQPEILTMLRSRTWSRTGNRCLSHHFITAPSTAHTLYSAVNRRASAQNCADDENFQLSTIMLLLLLLL